MASEKEIEKVLNLLTTAPRSEVESLHPSAMGHTKSLRTMILAQSNIVAIGIAEKVSDNKGTGKLSLMFYVEKKIALKDLTADQAIPPTVPEVLSGPQAIPTDVLVIGKLMLQDADPLVTRNPIQPGFSIGHKDITAGTLGALVTDGKDFFLLSNSHVLANSGLGKKGDAILYPGPADGGKNPDDLVAHLEKNVPFSKTEDFVNLVDCALARPTLAGLTILSAEIEGIGIPKGTVKPKRGMKIEKLGRTTGKTTGEIRDVHFRTQLDYEGVGKIGFKEQVFCTRYSAGGDSGSLVLDQKTGKAVGLHFAGADGGSVFNSIDEVLTALKVQLVTKAIQVAVPQKVSSKKGIATKGKRGLAKAANLKRRVPRKAALKKQTKKSSEKRVKKIM